MMLPVHTHGSLIIAYIIAILILILYTVDTVIQYRTREKRYLPARVLHLVVILFVDVGLISFIEVDRSEKGTRWVPAMWVLIQFSMLLEMSLEAMVFLRICSSLTKDIRPRKLAYILIFSIISIVLIFDILAVAFVLAESHNHIAVVLQVLGYVSAHMFASFFPLWLLGREGDLLPKLRNRRSWGLLSCSSFSILAAVASLGLFGLPGLYPKFLGGLIVMFVSLIPWTILQGYKLTKVDVEPESPESFGCDRNALRDLVELSVMEYELQVGSNGLVCKAEDLGECQKVVSWGLDSSTPTGERFS